MLLVLPDQGQDVYDLNYREAHLASLLRMMLHNLSDLTFQKDIGLSDFEQLELDGSDFIL